MYTVRSAITYERHKSFGQSVTTCSSPALPSAWAAPALSPSGTYFLQFHVVCASSCSNLPKHPLTTTWVQQHLTSCCCPGSTSKPTWFPLTHQPAHFVPQTVHLYMPPMDTRIKWAILTAAYFSIEGVTGKAVYEDGLSSHCTCCTSHCFSLVDRECQDLISPSSSSPSLSNLAVPLSSLWPTQSLYLKS